jgi:hypothetical protein
MWASSSPYIRVKLDDRGKYTRALNCGVNKCGKKFK